MRAGRGVPYVLALASSLLIAAAVTVPAAHAEASRARAEPAAVLSGAGVLDDVVAISPRNAWAVGHFGGIDHPKSLLEHWNGKGWRRVSVKPAAGWLDGVAATSAHDVWAVGVSDGAPPLILHFDGTRWRRVPGAPVRGISALLVDVTAISPRNAWAVGITGNKSLIEHWNGTTWRRARSPAVGSGAGLIGISGTSAHSLWAVGATGGLVTEAARLAGLATPATGTVRLGHRAARPKVEPLILHWNGAGWRRVSIPEPAAGGMLVGMYAASSRNAWAAGCTRTFDKIKARPLALHWNGAAWK